MNYGFNSKSYKMMKTYGHQIIQNLTKIIDVKFVRFCKILAVIDKISNFHEIAPNFTYSQKSEFLKYDWNFTDQLLLPINFMAGTCKESTFSFLPDFVSH